MGGLLDFLNTDQGRMGLGLLAAAGPRSDGAGFGQRLQEGMGQFDAYKANALKQQMLQAQMQQAMEQAAQQKADRARQQTIQQGMGQFFKPGQQALSPLMGDAATGIMPSAGREAVAPSFDTAGAAQFLAQNGEYEKALPMLQSLQPKERTLKEGETVFMGDKPFLSAPKAPKEIDPNKPFMMVDGKIVPNNAYQDFDLRSKRAGANSQTVNMAAPENKFNQDIGAGLAKDALSLVDVARTAPGVISTSRSIRTALDNGAITGTGADIRLGVQKALETAGLVGDGKAASTQELMAGLSKMTLSGIKTSGLGGGAGFTDKDKIFLESAISGTIADTPENLRRVADLSEKIARANHQKGNQVLGRWQKNPALAGFAQDISIDAIPQEQSTSAKKPNLVNDLPKTAPVGSRARDTTTGQVMRFDGMKWKPE